MGRVCVGRLCYGPSLQWAEFAMGRDVQLPLRSTLPIPRYCHRHHNNGVRDNRWWGAMSTALLKSNRVASDCLVP